MEKILKDAEELIAKIRSAKEKRQVHCKRIAEKNEKYQESGDPQEGEKILMDITNLQKSIDAERPLKDEVHRLLAAAESRGNELLYQSREMMETADSLRKAWRDLLFFSAVPVKESGKTKH